MNLEERLKTLLVGSEPALSKVHPLLASRVQKLITLAANDGLYFGAFMGLRTWEQQDALYAQGRTKPGSKVTNARGGESWHNFGLAIDLVEDGDPDKAGIQWSWKNNADYLKLGKFAKQVGLSWGGWWKSFKDYPHVELTANYTLSQVRIMWGVMTHEHTQQEALNVIWHNVTDRLGMLNGCVPVSS